MNEPGDIPLNNSATPDTKPCGLVAIIPAIGMSSCRGRAEAFARKLSSKLRTLGSQADDERSFPEDEPIINGISKNTWMPAEDSEIVTELQPVRNETDTFFDFDCELESPGSPVDECEYLRLVETASNTPHNSTTESGYACESATSSHSSSYGNAINNANVSNDESRSKSQDSSLQFPELIKVSKENCNVQQNDEEFESPLQQQKDTESQSPLYTIPILDTNDIEFPPVGHDFNEMQACFSRNENMTEIQNNIITDLQIQSSLKETLHQHINDSTDSCKETGNNEVIQINGNNNLQYTFVQEVLNDTHPEAEQFLKIEVSENDEDKCKQDGQAKENLNELVYTVNIDQGEQKKQHTNSTNITDDEDECRPQRVRRCSSLKTGKTPPGTPGRKKIVRFADVLGLDLADVKTFLDEIPTIPKSAFMDLEIIDSEPPIQLGPRSDKLLMPLFQQPGGLPTFLDIVREKQVSLENASVTDVLNQTITGTVRVRNLDFHKSVYIRYSLDNWRSFADLQANYVENSCDGFSDKFAFVIFGNSLQIGQRLEFAVRFQCKGQQYWDNNYGTNYCFQCLAAGNPIANTVSTFIPNTASNIVGLLSPTAGDAWCSSFY